VSDYTIGVTVDLPYEHTVGIVRDSLTKQGFGVLTEIDVAATLKDKLDIDAPAQVILGACRPELAHRALDAVPTIAALLPCNVVVRDIGGATRVEAVDPEAMMRLADDSTTLRKVAIEARKRLVAALVSLEGAR
jgi:uncharacterized protein (DUF302 family)